jgi:hypothetical protein
MDAQRRHARETLHTGRNSDLRTHTKKSKKSELRALIDSYIPHIGKKSRAQTKKNQEVRSTLTNN